MSTTSRRAPSEDAAAVESSVMAVAAGASRPLRDELFARIAFVSEASPTLAQAVDAEAVLARVVRRLVPQVADCCTLDVVLEDGGLQRVVAAHVDPDREELLRDLLVHHPLDLESSHPIARVLRSMKAEIHADVSDVAMADRVHGCPQLDLLPPSRPRAMMVVPLLARRRVVGVLLCSVERPGRQLGPADLALAEDLGASLALALDISQALPREQAARRKAERAADLAVRLHGMAASLSRPMLMEEVASTVVSEAVSALGASSGAVAKLDPTGTKLVVLSSVGVSDDIRAVVGEFSVASPLPAAESARTGLPVFLETIADRDARYPHLGVLQERLGNGAFVAVPITVEGRVTAVLGLTFEFPRVFPPAERVFVDALAHHCAQAFDRARLFKALSQAVDARDDALAVVAHDLRNPITGAKLSTRALQRRCAADPGASAMLQRVDRALDRMNGLISNLLDVARLDRGEVSLDRTKCDVRALVDAARDASCMQVEQAGLALVCSIGPGLGALLGDRDLLLRVFDNLVANAMKFTPAGGTITLSAERRDARVHLTVSDTGRGIATEHLPRLFDRYWQLRESAKLGSGLGLAIVKGIVRAHGGRVEVESAVGQGTTFHVWLEGAPADDEAAP